MKIDYDNSFDLYNKGKHELSRGDVTEAIKAFELSISIYPHFKTLELLGETLLTCARPAEAIVYLAASVTLGHNPFKGLYLLSQAQLSLGDKEEAIESLNKALKLNSNYKRAKQLLEQIQRGEASD